MVLLVFKAFFFHYFADTGMFENNAAISQQIELFTSLSLLDLEFLDLGEI